MGVDLVRLKNMEVGISKQGRTEERLFPVT